MTTVTGPGGGDVLNALKSGRIKDDDARLRAAAHLLESSFYEELFRAMRETIPEGGAVPGGSGKEMFEGMMDQNIATSAAMRSESGLGSALYRYFTAGSAGRGDASSGEGSTGPAREPGQASIPPAAQASRG